MVVAGPLAVVLAAGPGTRFGGGAHKLRSAAGGRPLAVRAVQAASASGLDVVVVTGAIELGPVLARHAPGAARVVDSPHWEEGLGASLAAGLSVARSEGRSAVVVGLADMPGVGPDDWAAVAAETATPIAVARWADGHRSPPARLDRSVWDALPTTGDVGARSLWTARPELVTDVPRPGTGDDVDTVADLAAWNDGGRERDATGP